ncbi:MAG: hypothetical protein ACREBC_27405, partial [Pyrinomonadaceae bacterium]
MSALSLSSSWTQVFRVPLKDANLSTSTGIYPWSLDGNSSPVVYIKNVTNSPQEYKMSLEFDGGVYVFGLKTLAAGQTVAIELRALRDNQVPDGYGKTIPLHVTAGKAHWSMRGRVQHSFLGRVEQFDPNKGESITAACGACCPDSFSQVWMLPGFVTGFVGSTSQFTVQQQDVDCFGNPQPPYPVPYAFFYSTHTAVATVNSSGFATAVGVGTTFIRSDVPATVYENCAAEAGNDEYCCNETTESVVCESQCDVDTLRVVVPNPPVTEVNGSPGVIAGQSFTIVLQAINSEGNINLANNSSVNISSSRTLDSTEIGLPSTVSLSGGQFTKGMQLNRVIGTELGTTFRFIPGGGGQSDLPIYTYFQVTASREGLVGGTTACNHVITSNDHFVALPATGLCNIGVVVRNASF